MPFACKNENHKDGFHRVVGGLNPFLHLVGETRPAPIHPSLGDTVETSLPQPEIMAAIAQKSVVSPEAAALARAIARRAAGGVK
jgi:hypothetical protein